jgi:hypothetical protein
MGFPAVSKQDACPVFGRATVSPATGAAPVGPKRTGSRYKAISLGILIAAPLAKVPPEKMTFLASFGQKGIVEEEKYSSIRDVKRWSPGSAGPLTL